MNTTSKRNKPPFSSKTQGSKVCKSTCAHALTSKPSDKVSTTSNLYKDLLAHMAFLLEYPNALWRSHLDTLMSSLALLPKNFVPDEVYDFVQVALKSPAIAFEKAYVSTFDFGKNTSLYLSAQDKDDAEQRVDLIVYSRYFQEMGYELDQESPDYLPALLELASVGNDSETLRVLTGILNDVTRLQKALREEGFDSYGSLIVALEHSIRAFVQEVA